jgi:hypothetical protein
VALNRCRLYPDARDVIVNALKLQRVSAFLIRGKDLNVQRWLVKRLARQIPNFENATKLEFLLSRRLDIRSDFEAFWVDFSEKLQTQANQDAVLRRLGELCREKPVILALYRFRWLEEDKVVRLYQFWEQLVQQVCHQKNPALRSRLILFLTDGVEESWQGNCPFQFVAPIEAEYPRFSVALAPLRDILQSDVRGWLEADEVYSELVKQIEDPQQVEYLMRKDILTWSQEPQQVLDAICGAFQLEEGIAEVEPYWKWAE